MKTEHDSGNPLSSSTREALRAQSSKRKARTEKTLSLEGLMNLPNNVIDLSSPKQKRTTRGGEAKNRGLLLSGSQISSKSIDLESSLEPPATCTPHECLVIIDPGLKHAEENLPSPDAEAPGSGIHLHPTLNVLTIPNSVDPLSKD
ncbi:unnamed protein product [Lactuca virosa]|uniref:Uncharacterized protein n=1 Tax=Lactuca virosa TaxID=75947 RepID=A0AAU9M4K4_9ASTR|nr:unnamed protein product [Lactuca virosa]